jgi:hypothetical protein
MDYRRHQAQRKHHKNLRMFELPARLEDVVDSFRDQYKVERGECMAECKNAVHDIVTKWECAGKVEGWSPTRGFIVRIGISSRTTTPATSGLQPEQIADDLGMLLLPEYR